MESDSMSVSTLLDRIDELESREAIRALAFDYCHGFDKGEYGRFISIWWEDCVWDIGPPFGRFEGHAGVHKAVHQVLWPAWEETHHLTSNNRITFADRDRAQSVCDVDCMGRLAGEETCTVVGATYRDKLVRRDGVWKIVERKVAIHYFNPLPGAVLSAPQAL